MYKENRLLKNNTNGAPVDKRYIVPKLSYEILNVSIETLALNLGLTTAMLQKVADDFSWIQWFPDEKSDIYLDEDADMLEGEDIFTVMADQYLDKNRKRLQVYNMAKNIAMTERYADLEVSLVDKARDAIVGIEASDVKSIKELSDVFRNLAKELQGMTSAVSFATDQQGLPTVIMRDLSGS